MTVTGKQINKFLMQDGWERKRRTRHGWQMRGSDAAGRKRLAIVPNTREVLKPGTISAILGPDQSNLGREWLAAKLGI